MSLGQTTGLRAFALLMLLMSAGISRGGAVPCSQLTYPPGPDSQGSSTFRLVEVSPRTFVFSIEDLKEFRTTWETPVVTVTGNHVIVDQTRREDEPRVAGPNCWMDEVRVTPAYYDTYVFEWRFNYPGRCSPCETWAFEQVLPRGIPTLSPVMMIAFVAGVVAAGFFALKRGAT